MPRVSPLSTQLFLALVAALAALFATFMRRAIQREGGGRLRGTLTGLLLLGAWLGISGVLASRGAVSDFSRLPPPFMLMASAYFLATLALAFSPLGTKLAAHAPLAGLVGYQVFRLPLELWLHAQYQAGVLPVQMTFLGLNFDIATGITAPLLALWIARGGAPRALVLAWNCLGLALLAVVVSIAVLSTPSPLRAFANDPSVTFVAQHPFVWLPTFLVQAALLGHVLVFRRLARDRRSP
jgi:hypothetical protein